MNLTIGEEDIPKSATASPDRPFEMIGVRDQYLKLQNVPNQRLTDSQVDELARQPHFENNQSRLDQLTNKANSKSDAEYNERKLYNLSVKQIGYRISDTWQDIIDELLHFDPRDGLRGFLETFLREDRLIYLGITLMVFTIAALFIRSV